MMYMTTARLSRYLLASFLFFSLSVFSQQPGQPPSIGDPPPAKQQPPMTEVEKAEKEASKAQENLRKIQAENEATNKKVADYIARLQKAAGGTVDKDTKDILEQAKRNQNLRSIFDYLRKYPGDNNFVNLLRQSMLSNPAQDPAQKLDGILKGYSDPTLPPDVQNRRQQFLKWLGPELRRSMLTITAKGTGQTTGNIANLNVTNPTQSFLGISNQSVYIPSDGKYQPYVGVIPETLIPPGTSTIPVDGYCADVHTPPVPDGISMPPLENWIPVGDQEDLMSGDDFLIISTTPVPAFTPEDIPDIISSPGFTAVTRDPAPDIIITWPGTDIPVGGTFDPNVDPETFAPIVVEVMNEVKSAAESITESGILTTPFSPDPPKQIQSTIQQVVWIYASVISGEAYEKPDFTTKVYEQFEDNSGREVTTLPEDQKDKLDSGIDDFWNVFTAVGVEAKVISEKSPGIDLDPTVLATVTTPFCKCNSISYTLEVKRGADVVHSATYTTPTNPKISIADFVYGDSLDIKITNIRPNCVCDDAECLFYPAESTNPQSPNYTDPDLTKPGKVDIEMANDPAGEISENSNCKHSNKAFNEDGTAYSFALKTQDEGTNSKAVFQKLRIKSYCQLEGCSKRLCAKYIQLNFVTAN